ncbi:DMT family transporter [Paenibacillus alkalitolerans]|uniref:DMT family transporter n=1 Tax=Paenibacillus alkalitolerans TaxID=2799335 RepID=UPI0018F28EC8|nr:DMT family transporter [Paenibacillus alkalitolerans]
MVRIVGLIAAVTLIWGYTWVVVKISLSSMPPFLFSGLRMLIGAFPLFIIQLVLRKALLPAANDWKNILTISLLMSLGYFGLSTYGMQFVDSGLTSVLVYSMPIFVTVLAHFFLKEKITLMKIIGLCLGAIAFVFIVGPQIFHTAFGIELVGQFLIIFAAASWACANIFSKLKFSNYDIIKMTSWQLFIGAFLLLAVSAITEPVTEVHWTFAAGLSLLFCGIFSTAFTFVAWFWVLGKIEASVASMTLMTVPILGLFFGWLQLNEKLTSNIAIGAVFICLGIFFSAYKGKSLQEKSKILYSKT